MYPKIVLNYEKLKHNTEKIARVCHQRNYSLMGVVKCISGWKEAVKAFEDGGVDYIADSRMKNLMEIETKLPKVLLRIPMLSEVSLVVKYSDISLNSSLKTIEEINNECITQNTTHKIIFMFDLGDLREGVFYKDNFVELFSKILTFNNIELIGIGTNLTCYGGVIPTETTLEKLNVINKIIKKVFNLDLEIISAGNSSMLYMMSNNQFDVSKFNNIRVGEGILFGRESAYGKLIKGMHHDVFTLHAQIIEVYNKPSLPEGKIGMNAFGEEVSFEDKGNMNRAIIGIGRQDIFDTHTLIPFDSNIEIIGSSSDHIILDIKNGNYKVGDILKFNLTYGGVLSLTTSKYVSKEVTYE